MLATRSGGTSLTTLVQNTGRSDEEISRTLPLWYCPEEDKCSNNSLY